CSWRNEERIATVGIRVASKASARSLLRRLFRCRARSERAIVSCQGLTVGAGFEYCMIHLWRPHLASEAAGDPGACDAPSDGRGIALCKPSASAGEVPHDRCCPRLEVRCGLA